MPEQVFGLLLVGVGAVTLIALVVALAVNRWGTGW